MDQKKALYVAVGIIAILAVVMVVFYKTKEYKSADSLQGEKTNQVTGEGNTKSPYEGIYALDSVVEAMEKRVSFFSINKREDHLGASIKMDSVGSNQNEYFECAEVKFEEPVFFVRCEIPDRGTISLDGKIIKEEGNPHFGVEGKLLWQFNSQALVEKSVRLSHSQD